MMHTDEVGAWIDDFVAEVGKLGVAILARDIWEYVGNSNLPETDLAKAALDWINYVHKRPTQEAAANDRDDCVSPGMKALAVEVLAKVERAATSHYCTACGRNVPGSDAEHLERFHLFGPTSARRVETDDDEYLTEIRRAQTIIDRLKAYRENLLTMPCQSTDLMRARIRELSTPARDDHDRAVLMLLDDFEKMERLTRASVKAEALRSSLNTTRQA